MFDADKTRIIGLLRRISDCCFYCAVHKYFCYYYYIVFQKKFTLLLFAITKSDVDRFH